MDYVDEIKERDKDNDKYLDIYFEWLKSQHLSKQTVDKHYMNADYYITSYLNYSEFTPMEKGCLLIDDFFNDFYIRKNVRATPSSISSIATSLIKFYFCMYKHGFVGKKDYDKFCITIDMNMNDWKENLIDYQLEFED